MLHLLKASLVAFVAIVAAPVATAATYTTVSKSISVATVLGSANETVQCPSGTTPISGGWRIGDPNSVRLTVWAPRVNGSKIFDGHLPRFVPAGSYPNGQGWTVYGYANGPISIEFYAVCASP